MLALLMDELGARELNAWEQQSDRAVSDSLAACCSADAAGAATLGSKSSQPSGRPLADVLRVALGSLRPAAAAEGDGCDGALGGKLQQQLALAELVGLRRRARVVVLRPAGPRVATPTPADPGAALLADLQAAARALDAAPEAELPQCEASQSGLAGEPGAAPNHRPQRWGRCDLVVLEVCGRADPDSVGDPGEPTQAPGGAADPDAERAGAEGDPKTLDPDPGPAAGGAAAAAGWRGGRWLSAARWRLDHDAAAKLLCRAARLHLGASPSTLTLRSLSFCFLFCNSTYVQAPPPCLVVFITCVLVGAF